MSSSGTMVQLAAFAEAATRPAASDRMSEEEFTAFYQRTAAQLWKYVCRLCGDPALADDVLQDAYCRFLNSSACRDDQPSRRKAYLYRIATNLVTDNWRKRRRESPLEAVPESSRASTGNQEQALLRADVGKGLEELRPRDRALLWMAYVEGDSHREIAQALGLRERSIRVLLFRARRKLTDAFEKLGFDYASAGTSKDRSVMMQSERDES